MLNVGPILGMNIVVAQISEDEGLDIHHLYPEGEPSLTGGSDHQVAQCEVNLRATRAGDEAQLIGNIRVAVTFECDRCLAPFSLPVDESFDLVYVPPLGTGDERELGENDLSLGFYQDGIINVDDLVREQIELALPMARLCTEACRGLCPACGANLNQDKCGCSNDLINERWAALKEIKTKLN
jgi:DUF177 domain-containing protein